MAILWAPFPVFLKGRPSEIALNAAIQTFTADIARKYQVKEHPTDEGDNIQMGYEGKAADVLALAREMVDQGIVDFTIDVDSKAEHRAILEGLLDPKYRDIAIEPVYDPPSDDTPLAKDALAAFMDQMENSGQSEARVLQDLLDSLFDDPESRTPQHLLSSLVELEEWVQVAKRRIEFAACH